MIYGGKWVPRPPPILEHRKTRILIAIPHQTNTTPQGGGEATNTNICNIIYIYIYNIYIYVTEKLGVWKNFRPPPHPLWKWAFFGDDSFLACRKLRQFCRFEDKDTS